MSDPIEAANLHESGPDTIPIGVDVRILRCEAAIHGDNAGCVCFLIGGVERIAAKYDTPFCGAPSYHLLGRKQRVRRSEVEIVGERM
jgi:hypothetical protein